MLIPYADEYPGVWTGSLYAGKWRIDRSPNRTYSVAASMTEAEIIGACGIMCAKQLDFFCR